MRLFIIISVLLGGAANVHGQGEDRDDIAQFAFQLGLSARVYGLRSEDFLYGCAKVSACAGACGPSLTAIGNSRIEKVALCPELASIAREPDAGTRAVALVRQWLARAAKKARPGLDAGARARLDCGLGRIELGKPDPAACQIEEDRLAARSLPQVADLSPDSARRAVPAFCFELESCAGSCGEPFNFLTKASWDALGDPQAKKPGSGKVTCPRFEAVLASRTPKEANARIDQFVKEHLGAYLTGLCGRLAPAARPAVACAAHKLGLLGPTGGPCGAATSCSDRPPPIQPAWKK